MTDIEPIVVSWLLSPAGLIVTAVVIIAAIIMKMAKLMTSYPFKEF